MTDQDKPPGPAGTLLNSLWRRGAVIAKVTAVDPRIRLDAAGGDGWEYDDITTLRTQWREVEVSPAGTPCPVCSRYPGMFSPAKPCAVCGSPTAAIGPPAPAAPVDAAPGESVPFVASRSELGAPVGVAADGGIRFGSPPYPPQDHPGPWRWLDSILVDADGSAVITSEDAFPPVVASPRVAELLRAAPELDKALRRVLTPGGDDLSTVVEEGLALLARIDAAKG